MPPKPFTAERRLSAFWAKVDKNGPVPENHPGLGHCWLWTGFIGDTGYGQLRVEGRRLIKAHHFLMGKAPRGLDWDHLCRTRSCVNPAHLEAVSRSVNLRRGLQSGLTPCCPQGHPFDEANTGYQGPNKDHRYCRTCLREKARRRHGWSEEAAKAPDKVERRDRPLPTHCAKSHLHTPENTHINAKGWQVCRTCGRDREKAWRARQHNTS